MSKKHRKPYEYEMFASDRGWCHGYCCKVFNYTKDPKKVIEVILRAGTVNDNLEKPKPFTDENARKAFRSGFVRGSGYAY